MSDPGARYATSVRDKPNVGVPPTRRLMVRPEQKRPIHKEAVPAKSPKKAGAALDAMTARALDRELQLVMMQVWQALPDDPPCPVEKLFVDKFRNEAGDAFKDILGLNVTKRLLNIFNPLNVKVHFTTKPDRKYLRQFLKEYNFVAFKRIARVVNTFAAQVKTVADYDRLCRQKDVHCGAAKITITPCYRFRQCPKNLRTIYSTPDEYTDIIEKALEMYDDAEETTTNITSESSAIPKEKEEKDIEQEVKSAATKCVATSTTDEEKTKDKDSDNTKTTSDTMTANKTVAIETQAITSQPTVENKPNVVKSTPASGTNKPQTESKTTPVKTQPTPAPAQQTTNKTVTTKPPVKAPTQPQEEKKVAAPVNTVSKVEPVKTNIENTTEVTKPKTVADPVKPKADATKLTLAKPNATPAKPNATPAKPNTTPSKTSTVTAAAKNNVVTVNKNTVANKTTVANKNTVVNQNAKKTPVKKNAAAAFTPKKVVNKKTIPAKANKMKSAKKSFEEKDDYEELDDEDILALMSGGIVLDECSGSDED